MRHLTILALFVLSVLCGIVLMGCSDGNGQLPGPAIISFTPTTGVAGTSVIITGSNFSGVSAVEFNGTAATSFTLNSTTQITATAPVGVTSGPITVTTPLGTATSLVPFAVIGAPDITSFVPDNGPLAGGTSVVITGTNFTGATVVDFGATPAASFTVDSDTQITATSPAHAAGSVAISVTAPGGVGTSTTTFTYLTAPALTTLVPNNGPETGGNTVTLTGTDLTGTTEVAFGATPAVSFTVDSDTQITAVAPAGTGTVSVTVTTPGGTSNGVSYTFVPAPALTTLVPDNGPEAGGTTVVLTGTGFTGSTAVAFGATPATSFTVDSDTQITAVSPAGTGAVAVTVTTAGGTSNGVTYTYTP